MNYIIQQDVERYLDITMTGNGINQFNDMLPRMQEMIDQECNRTWNFTNPVTENFNLATDYTFFPKYPVSTTVLDSNHPQAQGVVSITIGKLNGQGGTSVDLTYVYNFKTHIKLS